MIRPPSLPPQHAGIALVTLQRAMDGMLLTVPADVAPPAGTLLRLVREDGVALCFVRDGMPSTERQGSGKKAIAFGKVLLGMWSHDRSPDPLFEYDAFRSNVLALLDNERGLGGLLSGPVCELMNEQAFFNGVGNYLRAEILHRAGSLRLRLRSFEVEIKVKVKVYR